MVSNAPHALGPELKKLLWAQGPADLADWLDFVAIGALLAFVWSVEPRVFALLAVAMGLPYALVGPLAGVYVDRLPLRMVMIVSNLARALSTLAMAFAPNWPALLVLVFARSCVDSAFTPAKQAAIQALGTDHNLMRANGLSMAINQASKIVAPALGGLALTIWEPDQVFMVNAVVSLVAVAFLLSMATIERDIAASDRQPAMGTALAEGWQEIRRKPALRLAIALMALGFFAMFFYDTLIAPFVKQMGFDERDLGFTLTSVGAGGVLGALLMSRLKEQKGALLWVVLGASLSGATIVVLGTSEIAGWPLGAPALYASFALVGLATSATVVPLRTIIQSETTPERMARVSSLSEAINTGALVTSPFAGAALAELWSLGAAFIVGGCVLFGSALLAIANRSN